MPFQDTKDEVKEVIGEKTSPPALDKPPDVEKPSDAATTEQASINPNPLWCFGSRLTEIESWFESKGKLRLQIH